MPEVNMETFNKEYKSIIDKFKDNKKVHEFCDDIISALFKFKKFL